MQSKYKYLIAFLFLIFSIVNDSHAQLQKCKINIHSMKCIYSDDYGDNEELYGRIWALNLKTYGTVDNALNYFKTKEILKVGDGSGEVLEISRASYITLKKNQSHLWYDINKELTIKPNDKIIVIGELIDRDWEKNPDDKLMSTGSVWYKVVDLAKLNGAAYQVDLSFKNSQSKVNMLIFVK